MTEYAGKYLDPAISGPVRVHGSNQQPGTHEEHESDGNLCHDQSRPQDA